MFSDCWEKYTLEIEPLCEPFSFSLFHTTPQGPNSPAADFLQAPVTPPVSSRQTKQVALGYRNLAPG